MRMFFTKLTVAALLVTPMAAFSGCDVDEGPAEELGEGVDEAIDEAQEGDGLLDREDDTDVDIDLGNEN